MPLVQVWGVNQRFLASASSAIVRARSIPTASTTSGWWTSYASASMAASTSGSDLVISPPAIRTRLVARRSARPRRSEPSSGSSSHSTPSSASSSATRRAPTTSSDGLVSPGIRHAALRSTMRSSVSPTASRVARTAASPSSTACRSIRIFIARKPAARIASADSARSAGERRSPVEAYAGSASRAPPNSVATGWPVTFPIRSHSAASSGQ